MDTNIWLMATVDGTIVNENEKKIGPEIFSCSLNLAHVEEISGAGLIRMVALRIS